ncbi:hypothetical protein, partial [Rhizobium leguminosarum]|uniref:hypothetical protein n=1 Tax=Rhizobium leguminosarum TaxID=384 RepID=UPI003F95A520
HDIVERNTGPGAEFGDLGDQGITPVLQGNYFFESLAIGGDILADRRKTGLQKKRLMGAGQLMQNYTARLGDMKDVLQASGNIRQTQLSVLA